APGRSFPDRPRTHGSRTLPGCGPPPGSSWRVSRRYRHADWRDAQHLTLTPRGNDVFRDLQSAVRILRADQWRPVSFDAGDHVLELCSERFLRLDFEPHHLPLDHRRHWIHRNTIRAD